MPASPERQAADGVAGGPPRRGADAIGDDAGAGPAIGRRRLARHELVAELGELVTGYPLEGDDVASGELAAPVAQARRGGPAEALLVRFRRDVDGPRVVEHRRLETKAGERADAPKLELGLGDELLVAHLEVALRPRFPPELACEDHLRAPLSGEAGGVAGM